MKCIALQQFHKHTHFYKSKIVAVYLWIILIYEEARSMFEYTYFQNRETKVQAGCIMNS